MKQRSVYLAGGGEFSATAAIADRRVLDILSGSRVAIVPTAAARHSPELAAGNGVRYFAELGSDAAAVMILNETDAQDPKLCATLAESDLVYLTGGDPAHLVKVFRESTALEALRRAADQGSIIGGSSAGAMALGPVVAFPKEGIGEGLGLVDVVTIPHSESIPQARMDEIADAIGGDHPIVAIPAESACMVSGDRLESFGPDSVSVYIGGEWRTVEPNTGTLLGG